MTEVRAAVCKAGDDKSRTIRIREFLSCRAWRSLAGDIESTWIAIRLYTKFIGVSELFWLIAGRAEGIKKTYRAGVFCDFYGANI